jgi:ATP synthase mitochondrial F1 complex assembly factor 2
MTSIAGGVVDEAAAAAADDEFGDDGRKVIRTRGVKGDGKTLRWYKEVGVEQVQRASGTRWQVTLDGRPIQTPAGRRMVSPSEALAHSVAWEWASQQRTVRPFTMPMMSLLATAIDQVPLTRHVVVGALLNHLHTDTVCLRAPKSSSDASARALAVVQERRHAPLVEWFRREFNVPLTVFDGAESMIAKFEQPQQTITTLQWTLHNLSDHALAGLDMLVNSTKSTVIALATHRRRLSAADALAYSRVEENLQIEQWGQVEAGHDIDHADLTVRASSAALFLQLLPIDWQ